MFISEMGIKAEEGSLKVTLSKLFSPDKPAQGAERAKTKRDFEHYQKFCEELGKGIHASTNFIETSTLLKGSSEGCGRDGISKEKRGGNYNIQRVGAASLREESEKAGEKSQRKEKDLPNHARSLQNYISELHFLISLQHHNWEVLGVTKMGFIFKS